MKKFISVTIILAILAFFACIPAIAYEASSYTTPNTFGDNSSDGESDIIYSDRALDELPPDRIELSDEEKLNLAQDYIAQYGGSDDAENYTVLCFKTLSNGMNVVFVEPKDWVHNDSFAMVSLGKYLYGYSGDRSVKLYQNGVYTEFLDAYNSGMIDDAIVEELNDVMHFDRYAEQTETTQPEPAEMTEPAANAESVVPTSEPETKAEAPTVPPKKQATGDSATVDSAYSSASGVSGAVSTGDNISLVIMIIAAALAAAVIGCAALKKAV